jgi:hypothetical protein
MRSEQFADILRARTGCAEAIGEAAANRVRPAGLTDVRGRLLVIAADHPARAALRAGDRALAMGDRIDLLDRITVALSRPGVGGRWAPPTSWRTCCSSAPWTARWSSAR